jgi:uncharacterized membrane protein
MWYEIAMKRSSNPRKFLRPEESDRLRVAVALAEKGTSAEIKVVLVRHCWSDIRLRAARLFRKLNLDKTEQRNCVMVLLVLTNREFLIYGDEGIHQKVGQAFWDDVRDLALARFKEDRFGEGLAEGVGLIGQKLAEFYPYHANGKNEISDEIAYQE